MQRICNNRHAKLFEPENKILFPSISAVWLLLLLVATLFLPATHLWNFSALPFAMPGKMASYEPLAGSLTLPLSPERGLDEVTDWQDKRIDKTGFVNMGERGYNPRTREFISADLLSHAGSRDLYSYANNNPIAYCDPDGRLAKGFNTGYSGGSFSSAHSLAYNMGLVGGRAGYEVGSTIHHPIVDAYPVLGTGKMVAQSLTGADFLGRSMSSGQRMGAGISAVMSALPVTVVAQAAVRPLLGVTSSVATTKTVRQLGLPAPSIEPNAGGVLHSFVQGSDQVYYRVFTQGQTGGFLTAVKPGSSAFAQEALALPQQNTAAFIQKVLVPAGTRLQRSRALPAFGHQGGAEQFQLMDQIPARNFGQGVPLQ